MKLSCDYYRSLKVVTETVLFELLKLLLSLERCGSSLLNTDQSHQQQFVIDVCCSDI